MIKNIEKFHKWVRANSKADTNNMTAWENHLMEQINASGADSFEMSASETKSGKPETITFERTIEFDENDEVVKDEIEF